MDRHLCGVVMRHFATVTVAACSAYLTDASVVVKVASAAVCCCRFQLGDFAGGALLVPHRNHVAQRSRRHQSHSSLLLCRSTQFLKISWGFLKNIPNGDCILTKISILEIPRWQSERSFSWQTRSASSCRLNFVEIGRTVAETSRFLLLLFLAKSHWTVALN